MRKWNIQVVSGVLIFELLVSENKQRIKNIGIKATSTQGRKCYTSARFRVIYCYKFRLILRQFSGKTISFLDTKVHML